MILVLCMATVQVSSMIAFNMSITDILLVTPPNAETIYAECSFDTSMCGWTNYVVQYDDATDTVLKHGTAWHHITQESANKADYTLRDHTFDIPGEYPTFS